MSYKSSSTSSSSFGQNDGIALAKKELRILRISVKPKFGKPKKRAESCSNNSVVDKVGTKKGTALALSAMFFALKIS